MIQSHSSSTALSQARFSLESSCYSWSTPAYSVDCGRLKQAGGPIMLKPYRRKRRAWDLRILVRRVTRALKSGAARLAALGRRTSQAASA